MKSSTLHNLSIAFFIAGILLGLISGFVFKTIEFTEFGYDEKFNFQLMFATWESSFWGFLPLYALSVILNYLEKIYNKVNQLLNDNTFVPKSDTSNSKLRLSTVAYETSRKVVNAEKWICTKCGEPNDNKRRICKSCGKDK